MHVAVGDVGAVFELGEVFIQVVSRALPVLIRGGVLLVHPGAQFSQPDQQAESFCPDRRPSRVRQAVERKIRVDMCQA